VVDGDAGWVVDFGSTPPTPTFTPEQQSLFDELERALASLGRGMSHETVLRVAGPLVRQLHASRLSAGTIADHSLVRPVGVQEMLVGGDGRD
jgi:hypothetical protein